MYRISEELEMEELSDQDGVLPLEMLLEFMVSEKKIKAIYQMSITSYL